MAGLLGTFGTDLLAVEPPELVDVCHALAERFSRVSPSAPGTAPSAVPPRPLESVVM